MADENNNSNSCNNPEDNVFGLITKFCTSISRDISGCGWEDETDVPKFRNIVYEILLTKYPIDKTAPTKAKDELQKQICIAELDIRFCGDEGRNGTGEISLSERYEALTQVEELLNSEGGHQLKPVNDSLLFMMLKLTEIDSRPTKISRKKQFFNINNPIPPLQNNIFFPQRDYDYYRNVPKVKARPNFFAKASIDAMKWENKLKNKELHFFKFPIEMKAEKYENFFNKEAPTILNEKQETGPSSSKSKSNNHDGLLKNKNKYEKNEEKFKDKRSLRVLSMESAECQGTSYMKQFLSDTNYSCELLLYEAQKKGIHLELRRLSLKDFVSNLKLAAVGIQSETFIRNDKTGNFHILENTCVNGIVPMEIERYVEPFLMCGKSFKILNDLVLEKSKSNRLDSYVYKALCRAIDEYLNTFRQFVMLQQDNSLLSQLYITLRTMMRQLNSLEQYLTEIPIENPELKSKGILYLNSLWTQMKKSVKPEFITLMIFFIKRMCQVYFKFLQRWFIKAILNDPYEDLFIKNVLLTHGGKSFFNIENNIRKSAVPLFLIGDEETILNCGKYTMLLKSFKPNHPLFDVHCPEMTVCFNLEDLKVIKKDWSEYLEKAQVHCKIVNMQTIFDERKALKDEFQKQAIERNEARLAAWKEQQQKEVLKKKSMINIWRKQSEDDLNRKWKERQKKIFRELCVQRELELLEEQTLLKKNINLRKRIAYLNNCKNFLKEDIVLLGETINKEDKKQEGILKAATKRSGLTPLGDTTNIQYLKKSLSLVDVNELKIVKNNVELLLESKAIKSISCDSIFQSGYIYAAYGDKDTISQAASSNTLDQYHHIVDEENQQQSNIVKHSDSDRLNSNIESTSICSQNRERMMSAQLMSDSLKYVAFKDINKKHKPLTDLERNRNRVMTEEFYTPLSHPPQSPEPPVTLAAIDKPLTDLQRNKKRVMTEVYMTPLQHQKQQSSSSITGTVIDTGTNADTDINLNTLPSDNKHVELTDLQTNRLKMLHSSMIYKGGGSSHKEPEKNHLPPKLTQRGINRKRVLESEYGTRLQNAYLMDKEKQKTETEQQQQNKRNIPTLQIPEQQNLFNKKDDNLDADTPMSITSDISIGGTSTIASHPQCIDEFNNNNNCSNNNDIINLRSSGASALKTSSVLHDIEEISFDDSDESINQDNSFMSPSPSPLPQDYDQESQYVHYSHDHAQHQHYHHNYKSKIHRPYSSVENANACISLISAKFKKDYYQFCQNKNENPNQDPDKFKPNPPYMNLYKLMDENFAYSNENSCLPIAIFKDSPTTKDSKVSNNYSNSCGGTDSGGGTIGDVDNGEKPKKITCITHQDTFMIQKFLRESVMVPVRVHYQLVRNELLRILYEDTQIYEHFRCLRNYYFLLDGIFSEFITDGIIGRLENGSSPAQLLSFQTLHTVLYQAIINSQSSTTKFSDNLSFEVLEVPAQFVLTSPNVLNVLILSYRVESPLSLILTPEAMEHYKIIFQFLFKLRRVNYCLDHAYQYLKLPRDPKLAASPQFRRVQLIRYKLSHFVCSLQSYLYSNVFQSSWQRFKVALCKVEDVEMLYQAHANYLKEIKFLCLLNRRSENISKQLNLIFKISLRFYNVLKSDEFILNAETQVYEHKRYERLLHEEKEFDDFILYLMYLGQKVVSHGYQEEISNFICLMNLNEHYFDENQTIIKKQKSSSSHQLEINNT